MLAAVSVTTYYVQNTIEERLLSYRQVGGEGSLGGTTTEDPGTTQATAGDTTVESEKGAALGVAMGMGVGIGGSDAQGLSAAKLRCIFGLTDDVDAARAEEQARIDAVVEARAHQAAIEAGAAETEADAAAVADLDGEDDEIEDQSGNSAEHEDELPLAHGGMRAANSSSEDDSDVDQDDY